MENQLVIFTLAGERYGVDIAQVESIINLQPITPVPHAPTFVEGVTNLRGQILPVLDLRRRFGLPPAEPNKHTRIVAVEMNAQTVGLIVDEVNEVLRIAPEAIEPPAPLIVTAASAFIRGLARAGQKLIIVLDLAKVLSAQELASLPGDEAIS